jgi:hypothetical protein
MPYPNTLGREYTSSLREATQERGENWIFAGQNSRLRKIDNDLAILKITI